MNSILLGALALSGSNKTPQKPTYKKDNTYSTNMHNVMNNIEYNQVCQDFSKPEFLNQFDELCFDNTSLPVSINEVNGINKSLQRNLDFQKGYSEFQHSDMHYDVVSKDEFTHNNMTLATSKRDFSVNPTRKNRSLELFTGICEDYTPKKEKIPLFQPQSDLTWVNGMPSITGKVANRFLASNKNNMGNLPFQNNVRVVPGLDSKNQEGNYAVYRVDPRTTNELRSEINQKISYANKPLEVMKKGDMRGPDFNPTKYKLPDFRVQEFSDLVATRANISAPYTFGDYTNVDTMRHTEEHYLPGPAANTTMGNGPDAEKICFTTAKKVNFENDNTHAVTGVNKKFVMTNVESFTNYENQRVSTNHEITGNASRAAISSYTIDYNNIPLTTSRELMLHDTINNSMVRNIDGGHVFSNDMVLPITNRETMSTNNPILGPSANGKTMQIYNKQNANPTTREETSVQSIGFANPQAKTNKLYNEQSANPTIREDTSVQSIGFANPQAKTNKLYNEQSANHTTREETSVQSIGFANPQAKTNKLYNEQSANPTIREETSVHSIGIMNPQAKTNKLYNDQVANHTIREETSTNMLKSGPSASDKGIAKYFSDTAKSTIRETTEETKQTKGGFAFTLTTYVRDLVDKAKETIREMTEDTYSVGAANRSEIGTYAKDKNNIMRPTIRETTEETQQAAAPAHSNDIQSIYVRDNDEIARPTIRENTSTMTPGGRMHNSNISSYTKDYNDNARPTIKESTLIEDYVGPTSAMTEKKVSHTAANNMTINERREISTYNRPANAKGDLYGPTIDRENVRLNEPILYSYVPAPHKSLDNSIMPRNERKEIKLDSWDLNSGIMQNVKGNCKPSIVNSSYYITENRVNTLENNPLVSDMYHHKGTSFIKY